MDLLYDVFRDVLVGTLEPNRGEVKCVRRRLHV